MVIYMLKNIIYILCLFFLSSCGNEESIKLSPESIALVANAGEDFTIDEQTEVTFDVTGLDADTTIASYMWTQISGTNITFNTSTLGIVSFITPTVTASEVLVFSLIVTGNDGVSTSDQISVTINPVNLNPVAGAGEDISVDEQILVTLEGTGEDTDGTISTYEWAQISSGATLALTNAATASMSFTTPKLTASESLVFSLTVTDNEGATNSDQVSVIVNPVNTAPVANAASILLPVSQSELLSFLPGSDSDVDSLLYSIQSQPTLGSIEIIDFSTGEFRYIPSGETGTDQFSYAVSDYEFTSNIAVVNITLDPVDSIEAGPNDVKADAEIIYQKSTITGSLSTAEDVDWFRFDAFTTGSIAIFLDVPTNSPDVYFDIIITDSAGSQLVSTQTGIDLMVYASVIAGESYYVQLISATNFSSESYILEIENYISGQAVLGWIAPTKNTDSSDLVDLIGYKFYYGLSGGSLDQIIEVLDPSLLTYTIKHFRFDGLTYDFAITAKNSLHIESNLSSIVSKSF